MLVISDVLFTVDFLGPVKSSGGVSGPINTSLWRNRLARSAVNRKVGGSNPPRDDLFFDSHFGYVLLLLAAKQLAPKSSKYNQRKVQHVYFLRYTPS